jgi:hypothetical protein
MYEIFIKRYIGLFINFINIAAERNYHINIIKNDNT